MASVHSRMRKDVPTARHAVRAARATLSQPRFRGKHIVMVKGKIFAARTGTEAAKIFKEVIRKYPHAKPTITYIPKETLLIVTSTGHESYVSF